MHSILEKQRIQVKRLSLNREKLKQYCGQLELERIPEQPSSPRDQKQILLNSYRAGHLVKYEQQQQQISIKPKRKSQIQQWNSNTNNQSIAKDMSSITLGGGSVNDGESGRQIANLHKQVSLHLQSSTGFSNDRKHIYFAGNQNGPFSGGFTGGDYGTIRGQPLQTQLPPEELLIKLPESAPRHYTHIVIKNHAFTPSRYEEGTGRMSPVSQVTQKLKGDVQELKWKANQTFFSQLTQKQIQHHHQQEGLKKDQQQSPALLDPIGYYENRYFPFGFDNPEKLQQYLREQANKPNGKGIASSQDINKNPGILASIHAYEHEAEMENSRQIESSIEQDFDRRQQSLVESVKTTSWNKRYEDGGSSRKYSHQIQNNKGMIEKYLKSSGIGGCGSLPKRHSTGLAPGSHNLSKSLVRGGLTLLGGETNQHSPAIAHWAASGNTSKAKRQGGLSTTMQPEGIVGGGESGDALAPLEDEDIGLQQPKLKETLRDVSAGAIAPVSSDHHGIFKGKNTSHGAANNFSLLQPSARNNSMNRLRSEASNHQDGFLMGQRRSRDLRQEIMNQRMAATFRLKNMNMKVPVMWKFKEDAFMRFNEENKKRNTAASPSTSPQLKGAIQGKVKYPRVE